jgi:hypothetical protein
MIQHFVSSPDGALASRLSQPPKPRTTISGGQRLGTEWLGPTHSDTQSQTNRTRSGQVKYNRRGAALLQNVELMPKHQDFGFKPSSRLAAVGDRIVNRALALRNDCENSARRRGFAKKTRASLLASPLPGSRAPDGDGCNDDYRSRNHAVPLYWNTAPRKTLSSRGRSNAHTMRGD